VAITAYLYYQDVRSALKWLSKAFGFKRSGPSNTRDGKIVHAAMQFGDAMVMMGDPGPKYRTSKRTMHRTHCLHVSVGDVDAHYARARRAGARIIAELEDTPFGARRYGAEDLEGHHWYFSQPVGTDRRRG
jgi:PhnB protein